ncbi:flagellar export protein FliJ [Paenibacillus daejeonensis]|uniref:flagellar export protein FliJ n=1 Tax=Paenibacillus daejeonensis TaxID=135193 RepID=UPI00035D2996|nr:flagellar export protein FliJ [Paenibacillus daejeonensis]
MAKFNYPYQKIVDLKSSEKTQAEWILSTALGKLQDEEKTLDELRREKAQHQEAMLHSASQVISLSELRISQDYIRFLDECIERKIQDVRSAQRDVEISQTKLTDKMMDEKVWLKAKEKSAFRFRQELLLREQNELDEMASVRYVTPAHS